MKAKRTLNNLSDSGSNRQLTLKEQGFYKKAVWVKTRKLALQRDNYLCQHCKKENRMSIANTVHHIKPLEEHPELALKLSNLESLCQRCHEATKARENAEKIPREVRVIKIS